VISRWHTLGPRQRVSLLPIAGFLAIAYPRIKAEYYYARIRGSDSTSNLVGWFFSLEHSGDAAVAPLIRLLGHREPWKP
jgi:hypothetical protein